MEGVYNPIFRITWPGPGTTGIIIVLSMLFVVLVVYLLVAYLKIRERERLHNYQLFLFQVKRKGLSSFQIKILNNMASYMKLSNPTAITVNSSLFESMLFDFVEYLQKSRENEEERMDICRDLLVIYEKLYVRPAYREPLSSMSEVEDGQILYVTAAPGKTYIGKVSGRGKNFLALQLFTPVKNIKEFEGEQELGIFIVRVNDAEYRIKTKSAGVEGNRVLAVFSDDIVREKAYRHPYINVVVPVVIIQPWNSETEEELEFDGTIYRLNEFECELRTEVPMSYEREYTLVFEMSDYSFRVMARVISSRTVEHEKVYYLTMKFREMSKPAIAVLSNYISDHL